ncbi:hypothetical protein ABH920_000756 [Catenulispora sp. EB89]
MTADSAGRPTGAYLGATAAELGHTTPQETAQAGSASARSSGGAA